MRLFALFSSFLSFGIGIVLLTDDIADDAEFTLTSAIALAILSLGSLGLAIRFD